MDLTAKLADELWCLIFDYVPSLSHKFKLAAVNRRFRRCVMTILEKPMPLELDFRKTTSGRVRVNGCDLRLVKWLVALQVLAEKTRFVSIDFVAYHVRCAGQFWGNILTILIEADCLSEVTSLKTRSLFDCDPNVWCSLFARCPKLEILDLEGAFWRSSALPEALKNKALTELSLWLFDYKQTTLRRLLKGLVPHKLRKVHLSLSRTLELEVWDLAELVRELGETVWSDLEEIFVHSMPPDWPPLVHKEQLFGALVGSLPKLSRCHILSFGSHQSEISAPAILSVLNARNRSTKLAMVHQSYRRASYVFLGQAGCVKVHVIRQLQQRHPELQFDFDQDLHLNFQLGNVSFCVQIRADVYRTCRHVNCINNQCHSFYPCVLDRLAEATRGNISAHVEDYRLDRCRVGRVAADLKKWYTYYGIDVTEVNQDHDLVTLTALSKIWKAGNTFYITIASGPCFFNPCVRCLIID